MSTRACIVEKCTPFEAKLSELFQEHDLFGFVSECYGLLSLSGDEYILDDMDKILVHHGVTL